MIQSSAIYSKYLSDEAMLKIVSDESLIQKMLQFEIALSTAQSKLGMIPDEASAEIDRALSKIKISPRDLTEGTLKNGVPVVPFLSAIKEKLSSAAKDYLHYGTTSQDVMDTAQVLIIKDAIVLIEERLQLFIQHLQKLINEYGSTPLMARTRGQLAMPITFEIKANAWLLPLKRQVERLNEMKKRLLCVQLGGAAGDLSVYEEKSQALVKELSEILQLRSSHQWHTQRDNLCEFTNWLAILTGILGKFGADVLVMAQTEINEVIEMEDGGKSSAMPHKNNPVLSEALVAIARINATLQLQQLQSMVHVNERDATAWILEWNSIPQMLVNAAIALKHAITITGKMKVDTEMMKHNVETFLKSST
jgi:3-carboxy-cis,cis-muconate cycloisomerase